ncbi:MAG: YqgE/AlgH family protein [Tunicatimonas sp.]
MKNQAYHPAKGDLLLSEPFLADTNFERSVVLICEHTSEGALGYILNKPSLLTVADVLDEAAGFDELVYTGGPVQQNTLHFVHRTPSLREGADRLGEALYWGGNFEQMLSLINTRQLAAQDIRFFAGYSGWAPGQLAAEMDEEAWIVCEQATIEQVFDTPPEQLWRDVLRTMGGKYRMFSNYPTDPRLN